MACQMTTLKQQSQGGVETPTDAPPYYWRADCPQQCRHDHGLLHCRHDHGLLHRRYDRGLLHRWYDCGLQYRGPQHCWYDHM